MVGQRAAVGLLPGTLVQRAMLATGPVIGPDQAQVGVVLKGGQLPADGLAPGDVVQVFRLPGAVAQNAAPTDGSGQPAAGPVPALLAKGVVFAARPDPAVTGGWLVTVTVPAAAAPAVAGASGAGLVALVAVAS